MEFPGIRVFQILGFGCLGVVVFFCVRYILATRRPVFVPRDGNVLLTPPLHARAGILSFSEGAVTQLIRDADRFTEATPGGTIRQGESIATAMGTAVVTIPDIGTLEIGDHTEVSFANLIPESAVFFQTYGTVRYIADTAPISIRMLHSVLTGKGTALLSYENFNATVKVESGSFMVGIVDPNNATHTYTARTGQTMDINDVERSVTVK